MSGTRKNLWETWLILYSEFERNLSQQGGRTCGKLTSGYRFGYGFGYSFVFSFGYRLDQDVTFANCYFRVLTFFFHRVYLKWKCQKIITILISQEKKLSFEKGVKKSETGL